MFLKDANEPYASKMDKMCLEEKCKRNRPVNITQERNTGQTDS